MREIGKYGPEVFIIALVVQWEFIQHDIFYPAVLLFNPHGEKSYSTT